MRLVTKSQALSVIGKSKHYPLVNIFLFNLILKNIVSFDLLTMSEKKSLIKILEGKNKRFFYDKKTKKIRCVE